MWQKKAKVIVVVVLLLVVGVALWSMWREGVRARIEVAKLTATLQDRELKEAGFIKASEKAEKDLGDTIEGLERELEVARKAGASPLVAVDVKTGTEIVSIPIPTPTPAQPAETPEVSELHTQEVDEESVESTAHIEVGVSSRVTGLVAANQVGELHLAGSVTTYLKGDGWTRTVVQQLDEGESTIQYSTTLREALEVYRDQASRVVLGLRAPRHWRGGVVAGLGLCYSSSADVCVFVGYGVQF